MTRIDWVVLKRLMSRIALAVTIFWGLAALVESLDAWRYDHLAPIGGPLLVVISIAASSVSWAINALPVTLLIGTIIGLLDLEARGEMTIIKSSGISAWRVLRAPLLVTIFVIGPLAIAADSGTVAINDAMSIQLPEADSGRELWLEQSGNGRYYVLLAEHPHARGTVLERVTFFLPQELGGPRIEAPRVEFRDGVWHIAEGTRFASDAVPERIVNVEVPTGTTAGDLNARVSSPSGLTIAELARLASLDISDARLKSRVQTRLAKLLVLPFTLGAAMLIAFAFTTGYRRTNKYGATVLYGIVLGFVVYLVMEMAAIAGSAGILQPTFAAFAPAFVAMVIGTTVLLFREDGRR